MLDRCKLNVMIRQIAEVTLLFCTRVTYAGYYNASIHM